MTFTATTNLSLPIITTGTESGTWGDVVDNGLTSYLDIAIAGGLAVTITTADVTLTKTAGTSSATGIVSTTAQYAILNISGAKTAARNLNLPITSKSYIINNAGTGGYLLTVRGVTPTTGVTLVDGEECIVAWNGSDYVKVSSSVLTALTGTLTVANGGTGATTLTANNVVLGNGTSAPLFVAPSTSGNVLTSNGTTWQSTAPAAAGVTGGKTLFTSSGTGQTFTVPTGVTAVKVTVVAGGAAGGTVFTSGCNQFGGGGGGAGGGAVKWLTGLVPGGTLTVAVGAAGGASSVASGTSNTITTVSATAGAAGSNATGSPSLAAGGAGGIGTSGDLNMRGGGGGSGSSSASNGPGGSGGSSFMGGGGTNGSTGTYGGGGGGNSGAGSVGLVMFEY
jgi:hypothetical protein